MVVQNAESSAGRKFLTVRPDGIRFAAFGFGIFPGITF
jgi:hypothetical protein